MTPNDLQLTNQFGETSINKVDEVAASFKNAVFPSMAEIDPITTEDADDEATAIALVNVCKAKVNEILAALQSA